VKLAQIEKSGEGVPAGAHR